MSEFILFPNLPRELQEKIWILSLPLGRVIEPPRSSFHESSSLRATCKESRRIYLQAYHEISVPRYTDDHLHHILKYRKNIIKPQVSLYFDPRRDLLVFDYGIGFNLLEALREGGVGNLGFPGLINSTRYVATNYIRKRGMLPGEDFNVSDGLLMRLAQSFPNLKEFIILVGQTLPVGTGPLQIPIDKDIIIPGSEMWEIRRVVLSRAQTSFTNFQAQHSNMGLPEVKVLFRTFEGLYDADNNSFPWANRGC
ncbi:hypothetical protein G7Y89_g14643 [Cudoniella acicularis]|uniref:2EXR domain-containing protein n=1 Tax=Cudoniella acicularis TaxID=354080 RepID=A0A8H4QYW9_9HELO|nr:hypothetical protein G7Y89_g14643 [Cudoniella acicularis]